MYDRLNQKFIVCTASLFIQGLCFWQETASCGSVGTRVTAGTDPAALLLQPHKHGTEGNLEDFAGVASPLLGMREFVIKPAGLRMSLLPG